MLVLAGAVWLGVGVSGFVDPEGLADWVDFELGSRTAVAEFRAMYGGLSLSLALLHLVAAFRGAWLRPALLMSASITLGLLFGRLSTLAIEGIFGPVAVALAGVEVLLLAIAGLALWRLWREPGPGEGQTSGPPQSEHLEE